MHYGQHRHLVLLVLFQLYLLPQLIPAKEQPQTATDKHGVDITSFSLAKARNGKVLVTPLDQMLGWIVLLRQQLLRRTLQQDMPGIWKRQRAAGKIQQRLPETQGFPCNLTVARSAAPPDSVHRLRPGDIDIVAAMGDSLLAGSGIISEHLLHIANDYRSLTFATGGRGTWRQYLTLPNILRVFNPAVYGYAVADGLTTERSSRLNVAESMAMSRDMIFQARVLIKRWRQDARVNLTQHWKLLTIFVGSNDICSESCHYDVPERLLRQHEEDLKRTLRELRDQVPRLYIILLPSVNPLKTLAQMSNKSPFCYAAHSVFCSCVFKAQESQAQAALSNLIDKWQAIDARVAALPEFRTDTFVVNYRHFIADAQLLQLPDGAIDFRVFAVDCMHWSQLGQAIVANTLWNSMLSDARDQRLEWPFVRFECPTQAQPFLRTWANVGRMALGNSTAGIG